MTAFPGDVSGPYRDTLRHRDAFPYSPIQIQPLSGTTLGAVVDAILAAMEGWPEGQVADACFIIKDDDGNQIASVEPDIRPLALHLYIGGSGKD